MDRRLAIPSLVAVTLGALALAALPAAAGAHGGEELSGQPARALVQQALGIVIQQGEGCEVAERLEAALESEDTEGVQLASARKALELVERGNTDAAVKQMNEALAPKEKPEEALEDHADAIEPDRGSAEWTGLAVGIGLIGLGGAALGLRRERP